MTLTDLSLEQLFLLALPALPNMWCLWHAMRHDFPNEKEKYLWMMGGVFLPLLGGLLYLCFGLRRSRPPSSTPFPPVRNHPVPSAPSDDVPRPPEQ